MSGRGAAPAAARRRRTPATPSRRCCARSSGGGASGRRSRTKRGAPPRAPSGRSPPRRDLTALDTFTVDPASARDFDDAVSAQREGDAVRVWIHIADVAAHVPPGSPLDQEARRRANSTYVPGTSSRCCRTCSARGRLQPRAGGRAARGDVEIELAGDGSVRAASFYRSRIRSDVRLDYDELDAIFAGREPAAGAGRRAARGRAADGRRARRAPRPDQPRRRVLRARVRLRLGGRRRRAPARSPQTESHRLIERLMILANEQVAQLLERKRVPAIYRVHAQPDPPRVERLVAQLHDLGIPTPPLRPGISAQEAGEVAAEASRLVRPRGRAARPRPGGVYIARAPIPEARPVQRAKHRPRRSRQPGLLSLHLADPPLPGPRRAPGAAGDAGGGGGGPAGGRGARRRPPTAASASASR